MDPTEGIALGIVAVAAMVLIRGFIKKKKNSCGCSDQPCAPKKPSDIKGK